MRIEASSGALELETLDFNEFGLLCRDTSSTAQRRLQIGDAILHRLPLVKTIYSAFKDLIGYLSPDSRVAMSKVVLVRLPEQEFEQIGFVTREDFSRLPFTPTVEEPIAVYLPMSYQIGGYTLFLPRSCLTPVDLSFEDGMKLVLTGAVSKDKPDLNFPEKHEGSS